ncbi:hypothetical protein EJB05_28823 [Eragrostis curvula]|uniref:TF-B3 domain-containing protein n=1 Tax=Eragrostis curvula TaxID=38414 RepID=A0A5J9USC5_9POAL|nr:hypothetical protein EJB05_28823 [Eragrostis curvula]
MAHKNQQGTSSAAAAAKERSMRKKKEKEKEKEKEKGNEERKEKGRGEDNGREGRKEKKGRKEAKEGDPVGAGELFFKVFFPHQSGERLKIPQPFCEYLKEEPNRPVSLKGPSGNTWQVMLTSVEEGLGFTQGWKEFVGDHSLQQGHFLVFTYDGHSEFSVVVLSNSGVEDKSALDAHPSEERVVKTEVEEGAQDADAAGASEQEASALPSVEGNGKSRKRVRQGIVKSPAPKRRLSVQKKPEKRKPEAFVDNSKAGSTVPESNKELSCMLDEYYNKARTRTKDVPRVGKVVSKKLRQPVVISQRRRITEEEKAHALKRAKEFKSKNPFTLQVMMESYVYVGFFMNIPCEFVREYLPQTAKKMTLWDPQGKPWEVQYVYYSERSVAAFSGGWGKFAVGNNLEKFDVCVFELLKEDNIKVHIYRVVPQITPLLRNKSM